MPLAWPAGRGRRRRPAALRSVRGEVANGDAASWRPALALLATHGSSFLRTARRHSLCRDDAEDAYARAVEILLAKGPFGDPHRLPGWMHVVTRHEAMRVRRSRDRLLGARIGCGIDDPEAIDPPAPTPGPAERAERRERVAHSAAVLAALKPQERRALALKAEGYSYAEIQELTGWTYTKVNRCLAEGRKRFLELFAAIHG
jgi:DNA-directed RNA polymerase specialized sigma24 family protein